MRRALARHDVLVREGIGTANGYVFKAAGDAFYAAFALAHDAVAAALHIQTVLTAEPWPEGATLKVRMALHTGSAESRDGDYFGRPLNRVARILSAGHGGQTLLSQATLELCRDALSEDVSVQDLGTHQLKDLPRPERVYQIRRAGLPCDFPPIKTLSMHPNNLRQQFMTLVGQEIQTSDV